MTSPLPILPRTWVQTGQVPKVNANKPVKERRQTVKVGQLDAELLDEELLQLLKGQLWDALKFFRASTVERYGTELVTILRIMLFKLSIWDRGTTYGALLQNLRFQSDKENGLPDKTPSLRQKVIYGVTTIGVRYIWVKFGFYMTENSWGEISGIRERIWKGLQYIEKTYDTCSLLNFLIFLYNGRYRTIIDRLLGLRLVPLARNMNRQISFEYLNRQLVWHTLTEFLLFVLPLLKLPRLKRQLQKRLISTNEQGLLASLPQRTCAICFQEKGTSGTLSTLVNPYQADECGHIYCYGCIMVRLKLAEGDGWPCIRCGVIIKEAHRWGEIVELSEDEVSDGT